MAVKGKDENFKLLRMKLDIKENGFKEQTFEMEEVFRFGLMVHYMKVIGKTIKLMEKVV